MVSDSGKRSEDYTTANALADALIQRDLARAELTQMLVERDKAREILLKIKTLHRRYWVTRGEASHRCAEDFQPWPCRTIAGMEEQP